MRLLFIDGNNLMMRSFYANPGLFDEDGRPIGAVFSGFRTLFKVAREIKPDRVFWFWDGGRSAHRMKIYPEYKQRKKGMDQLQMDNFYSQVHLMKAYLPSLGIAQLCLPDQEADDLIYRIAEFFDDAEVFIASADKDFYQLLGESCKIFNFGDNKVVDLKKFQDDYQILPNQWPIVRALTGDSSDNIKGVPGFGDVRALKLVQAMRPGKPLCEVAEIFGEKLVKALDSSIGELERNLALIDLERFPRELIDEVELARQLEVGADLEFNKEAFWAICEKHQFTALLAENFDWEYVYAS